MALGDFDGDGIRDFAVSNYYNSNIAILLGNSDGTFQPPVRLPVAQSAIGSLLAGDFNMPVESAIYGQCWSRFSNAFDAVGLGLGHTKFTRWRGVRIDHILAGPGWRFRRCWVGPDVHSDHHPVIAEVEWVGASD